MDSWGEIESFLDNSVDSLMLKIPDYPNARNVYMSRSDIQDAIDHLEINNPVVIKWSSGRYRMGCHRYKKSNGRYHSITISRYLYEEDVTETLWHELTHARQTEKCGEPELFYAKYYKQYGVSGEAYRNNPYEIEARRVATHMSVHKKLAYYI